MINCSTPTRMFPLGSYSAYFYFFVSFYLLCSLFSWLICVYIVGDCFVNQFGMWKAGLIVDPRTAPCLGRGPLYLLV